MDRKITTNPIYTIDFYRKYKSVNELIGAIWQQEEHK